MLASPSILILRSMNTFGILDHDSGVILAKISTRAPHNTPRIHLPPCNLGAMKPKKECW